MLKIWFDRGKVKLSLTKGHDLYYGNTSNTVIQKENMSHSRLTAKFQATIPQDIRATLKLKAGDQIIFEITANNHVVIKKAMPSDIDYLKSVESTLSEWGSVNDEEDYRDL